MRTAGSGQNAKVALNAGVTKHGVRNLQHGSTRHWLFRRISAGPISSRVHKRGIATPSITHSCEDGRMRISERR